MNLKVSLALAFSFYLACISGKTANLVQVEADGEPAKEPDQSAKKETSKHY